MKEWFPSHDRSGQQKFGDITQSYIHGSDVLLFVYNINMETTLSRIKWLYEEYKNKGLIRKQRIFVVGTHKDEWGENSITSDKASEFATSIGGNFCEISNTTKTLEHNLDIPYLLHDILDFEEYPQLSSHNGYIKMLLEEDEDEDQDESSCFGRTCNIT